MKTLEIKSIKKTNQTIEVFKEENMYCKVLWALWALAAMSYAQSAEVTMKEKDIFPNIIEHLRNKESIRFLSQVDWFEDGKEIPIKTKLVDEAYFAERNSGRMIVYKSLQDKAMTDLNLFLWTPAVDKLDTTMCSSVRATPIDTDLIFPKDVLRDMLIFTGKDTDTVPKKLYGLMAILANTIEKHCDKLKRVDVRDDKNHVVLLLDTGIDHLIEFKFTKTKMDEKLTIKDIDGLIMTVFKTVKVGDRIDKGSMIAKLTVLKSQHGITTEDILEMLDGFTCHDGVIRIKTSRVKRSLSGKSESEFEFSDADRIGDWMNDEFKVNDEKVKFDGFKRGAGSCTGQNSGTGLGSCRGDASCSGPNSGSGPNSCSGDASCSGNGSGKGSNSCSGDASCSGPNSGHCPNSCSAPASCSRPNSCS